MQWEGFSYNGQALHVHDCVYNVHSRMPYRRIHQIHAGTVLSTLNSHIIKIKPGKKHPSLNRESNPRPPAFRARARARAMKTVPDCVPNGRNCVPKRKIVSQNESSRFVESSPIRVFSVSILSRGHFCVPILQKYFYVLVSGFSCISGYFRTFID